MHTDAVGGTFLEEGYPRTPSKNFRARRGGFETRPYDTSMVETPRPHSGPAFPGGDKPLPYKTNGRARRPPYLSWWGRHSCLPSAQGPRA